MEFPTEVDSLLLRRFLEQYLVCVAVSAAEGVDVSGGGGSFRLPRSNYSTSSVDHPTLRGTRTGGKTFQSGGRYGLPPLQLESYPILSPAYVWSLSAKDGSEMRL